MPFTFNPALKLLPPQFSPQSSSFPLCRPALDLENSHDTFCCSDFPYYLSSQMSTWLLTSSGNTRISVTLLTQSPSGVKPEEVPHKILLNE